MNIDEPIREKLVRSKIVEIRNKAGWKCLSVMLTHQADIDFYFNKKAEEELAEFRSAKTRNNEIEEVADLIELRHGIKANEAEIDQRLLTEMDDIINRHMEYFSERITPVREAKLAQKGGFYPPIVIVLETR